MGEGIQGPSWLPFYLNYKYNEFTRLEAGY